MSIDLPISKSIANRLLMLQAIHGDPLMEVSCGMGDDVQVMHDALSTLTRQSFDSHSPLSIDCQASGTALRFLTAYCAQLEGCDVVLTGTERLCERPLGALVEALRSLGADIAYLGKEGCAPVHIKGHPFINSSFHQSIIPSIHHSINSSFSSQFVSALLLIGVEVETDCQSPYVEMTRQMIARYPQVELERDWSAAAFWYEYIALHGGEIELDGLRENSLQGDRCVADIFHPLGVETSYLPTGVRIKGNYSINSSFHQSIIPSIHHSINFASCPDLYPAVALTYECLHLPLEATGTESLPLKESDRLRSVREHKTYGDHRIAMALLAADLPCDDTACVTKSYPNFCSDLVAIRSSSAAIRSEAIGSLAGTIGGDIVVVVPRRGINDDGLGKKHALHKLISAAETEYVWLMDDDVTPPEALRFPCLSTSLPYEGKAWIGSCLFILPLRMTGGTSLLERLQVAEYAAIQQLTMETARRGHAVMCSGANMIVRRDRWLESWDDLHPEIASGDDMFLLESFKRRGLKIESIDDPAYTATVRAQTSWCAFFRQRMRWAGKAPHYTDKDIIACGMVITIANLLQIVCPAVLLIKFPIEYRLIKKRDPQVSFGVALLLEIIYPWYMLICLIGGLFRRVW